MLKLYRGKLTCLLPVWSVAACMAVCLIVITAPVAFADAVHIYDAAHVLDQAQVQNEAANLSYPVDIYTTNTFTGSASVFDQRTAGHIGHNLNLIVIAIDAIHHHLAIVGGKDVPLSNDQYASAISSFKDSFNGGDFTGATIAALQSLEGSLNGSSSNSSSVPPGNQVDTSSYNDQPAASAFPIDLSAIACIIGLIALLVIGGIFFIVVRAIGRRAGASYGPPRTPRPGMNSWEAGGLGAAAGGLIGYELGREEGEREAREREQSNNDGGFFGGGASGDFGNGSFSGGDIGGGASGDFGGGNIGGGSSGNF
jgi:hypothetical protein